MKHETCKSATYRIWIAGGCQEAIAACRSFTMRGLCVSVHPVAAVESEYSLWTRDLEAEILPACAELGIGFVPFAPLGRGMLTGTLSSDQRFGRGDMRRKLPRFQGASYQHNLLLLDTLRAIGIEKGLTLAQLAIAWLLGQREFIVPIPGADRTSYVQENASAAEI